MHQPMVGNGMAGMQGFPMGGLRMGYNMAGQGMGGGYPGYTGYDAGQGFGQFGGAGGQFVAGIPVLHVLKTPRDPTQRLSGVDITNNVMRGSPETTGPNF